VRPEVSSWVSRRSGCAPAVRTDRVVRAELEEERRDTEFRCDLPQRLLRWDTLPDLDAAEVGIGEAGLGQLTLRESALPAQAPDALADRLGSSRRHVVSVDADLAAPSARIVPARFRRAVLPASRADDERARNEARAQYDDLRRLVEMAEN